MGEGKEASAWLDRATLCIYKLFDLKSHGALGKKLAFLPASRRLGHRSLYLLGPEKGFAFATEHQIAAVLTDSHAHHYSPAMLTMLEEAPSSIA